MQITETKIKVSDLVENYKDNGDGGVFGYNDRLTIRPSFQREFIYGEKQRAAVIDSVMNRFPLISCTGLRPERTATKFSTDNSGRFLSRSMSTRISPSKSTATTNSSKT